MSKAFALLGHPVSHSLSPRMFNAMFARLDIDARYSAIDIAPDAPLCLREVFATHGLSGVNLTVPHKTSVVEQLDHISESAERAGAVNVVVQEGGDLIGHNTDGRGFLDALSGEPGPKVVLLGAGGAARAIASAVIDDGTREVIVLNRSSKRAAAMLDQVRKTAADTALSHEPLTSASFAQAAPGTTLVVNCTGAGARSTIAEFQPSALGPDTQWVDINYWDTEPPGQAACIAAGVHFQTGHGMLAHQAAHGFFLFTGHRCAGNDLLEMIT